MRLFLSALLLLTPVVGFAAAAKGPLAGIPSGVYKLDKTHASLTWKVNHMGLSNYTARFTELDATLKLDAENPEKSTLTATVNPASVRTDYPNAEAKDFDAKLANGAEWFNSENFPDIRFTSTALKMATPTTGTLTGDLTFLGITKPVTLTVTVNGALAKHPFAGQPAVGFSATASIKRSDFGMGTYIPTVGDEVQLLIEVEFIKKAEPGSAR